MKYFKTKIVGIALAVSMLFGSTCVLADENDLESMYAATPVSYGEIVYVDLPEGNDGIWYSFTPSESGYYNLFSRNTTFTSNVYVCDSQGNYLYNSQRNEGAESFSIDCYFSEGQTYYFWIYYTAPWAGKTEISVSWPGQIAKSVNINGEDVNKKNYSADYLTDSVVLSVTPPEGEGYTYQWYRASVFGDREEIQGATESSYSVGVISRLYQCDICRGGVTRTVSFDSITWNNLPDFYGAERPAVSLGNSGVATIADIPAFEGSDDMVYIAFPTYYLWRSKTFRDTYTYNHSTIINLPWSTSMTMEVPPLNVTTIDRYGAADYYNVLIRSNTVLGGHCAFNDLIAFVRTEDNSGTINVGQTQETLLYNVMPEAEDFASDSSHTGTYADCYVYSFTPEVSGTYTISSSDLSNGDPYVAVFDDTFRFVADADNLDNSYFWQTAVAADDYNFSLPLNLEAGKTYYYVVWSSDMYAIKVDEQELMAQFNVTLTCDNTYNVTVTGSGHGSASASCETAPCGTEVTLTATPDSGYRFDSWEVISGGVTIDNDRFTMGYSDVEIRADFVAVSEQTSTAADDVTPAGTTPAASAPSDSFPSGSVFTGTTPAASTPTPAIPAADNSSVSEDGVAGFVERLYTIALGRASDPAGKQDWIDAITLRGETGAGAARGFLYSSEFLDKNVTSEEFVATLYRTFFDREPDQAGFNAWVEVLNNGAPKEEIIEGFINSTELANLCLQYGISSGGTGVPNIEIEPNQGTIDFATRLYTTCLGRNADQAGLMAWARQLANQRDTGTGAAHGFFFSTEFANQNVDNREFVTRLYRMFMNREPDQAGFDAWVALLDAGVSREEVFNGFAQSIEFARICALYGIVR